MRHAVVGMLLAMLLLPAVARAQVRGEVESIGFGGYYRPDCWTPVVVRLRTAGLKAEFYQLQIVQEDLDRDRAVYTRVISVDPSQAEQRFWMYFIPTPAGLPDAQSGGSLADLRKNLRVRLATNARSPRPVGELAVTQVPESLDGIGAAQAVGGATSVRGRRLVVAVHDGNARPTFAEYRASVGMSEDVTVVMTRPADLPESALAYDAVDAVLWLNADANRLDEGGARRTAAIERYVRQGGRLVVCQPQERQNLAPLAGLLPVEYVDPAGPGLYKVQVREAPQLEPLRGLARSTAGDAWETVKGPFRMAVGTPKANAIVEDRRTIAWPDGTTSPWLVRGVYGLGGVTWVAQDLGDPALTARTALAGWTHVWDEVFGWANDSQRPIINPTGRDDDRGYPDTQRGTDVGFALLPGMNHEGRGAALVLLAVVFFVVYWIAAGPGSYFALINWQKKQWSWLAFAAAAVVATLVTLAVVRLVLRGPPQVRHVTVVQSAPNDPAIARARVGLYIPNDGSIPVTVAGTAPASLSGVTAFAEHPAQGRRDDTAPPPVQGEYAVPVPDADNAATGVAGEADTAANPAVAFPYRSTLKKVQATWVGDLPGRIDGVAKLSPKGLRGAEGVLTNNAGVDLANVYVAFRNRSGQTRVLFREKWPKGTSLDFARDVSDSPLRVLGTGDQSVDASGRLRFATPYDGRRDGPPIVDVIGTGYADGGWTAWWFQALRSSSAGGFSVSAYADDGGQYSRSLPVMSLYDLIPPPRRKRDDTGFDRFEILRRGARHLNLSHVVRNGQMLVIGSAADKRPIPFPFLVDGDPYGGTGDVLYQFVVPLDRTPPLEPTTSPATQKSEDGG